MKTCDPPLLFSLPPFSLPQRVQVWGRERCTTLHHLPLSQSWRVNSLWRPDALNTTRSMFVGQICTRRGCDSKVFRVFGVKSNIKEKNNQCGRWNGSVQLDCFHQHRLSQYYPNHQGILCTLSKQELYSLERELTFAIRRWQSGLWDHPDQMTISDRASSGGLSR